MVSMSQRWRNFKEHLRFKYAPGLVDWMLDKSTLRAKSWIRANGGLRMLVDNTVLYHAVTHETAWVSTGKSKWGPHDIDTGYAARIPVHPTNLYSREYRNICFLPGLAHLARLDLATLFTSAELKDEQFRQPSGRYRGYGYFDHSLFGDLNFASIDGHVFQLLVRLFSTCRRPNSSSGHVSIDIKTILILQHWSDVWDRTTVRMLGTSTLRTGMGYFASLLWTSS